ASRRCSSGAPLAKIAKTNHLQRPWIAHWVTKHLHKDRLPEAVELGDGRAALGSEGFGLVEDGGEAALICQRGKRDGFTLEVFEMPVVAAIRQTKLPKKVIEVLRIEVRCAWSKHFDAICTHAKREIDELEASRVVSKHD